MNVLTALWYDNQARLSKYGSMDWLINLAGEINIYNLLFLQIDFQTYLL